MTRRVAMRTDRVFLRRNGRRTVSLMSAIALLPAPTDRRELDRLVALLRTLNQ